MAVKFQDYYETLGVKRDASQQEIQRAYRQLARQYHPDINKDQAGTEKFHHITEAYEVLKNPETRKKYDALGANWKAGQSFTPPPGFEGMRFEFRGGGPGGFQGSSQGFSDFFEMLFRRDGQPGQAGGVEDLLHNMGSRHRGARAQPRRPQPTEAKITITLEDAYHGATKQLALQDAATGSTKTLQVKIPRGTTSGTKIRLPGQAAQTPNATPGSDILLHVSIQHHPRFEVHGHNLHTTVPITPWEAALGAKVEVETLDGSVTLTIPAGTPSGQKLRLREKGLPQRGADAKRGDLIVHTQIVVPKEISDRERELFESLAKESEFHPRKKPTD